MLKNLKIKILLGIYLTTLVYWCVLFFTKTKFNEYNYYYQLLLSLIPLTGGFYGIMSAKSWGGLKSRVGRGVFFISLGLITWGSGQIFWSYYTIAQIAEVPYPSLADVGYIISWPLWTYGVINLSRATGAKSALRKTKGKIAIVLVPLLAAAVSYYLLIQVARGGVIDFESGFTKLFFDLAYPIGDVIIISFAVLVFGLSFNYLGGKYKVAILLILAGYSLNYFTDFTFSYTTTAGTYYNGHWVDLMFPTVMTILSLGVSALDPYAGSGKGPKVEPVELASKETVDER